MKYTLTFMSFLVILATSTPSCNKLFPKKKKKSAPVTTQQTPTQENCALKDLRGQCITDASLCIEKDTEKGLCLKLDPCEAELKPEWCADKVMREFCTVNPDSTKCQTSSKGEGEAEANKPKAPTTPTEISLPKPGEIKTVSGCDVGKHTRKIHICGLYGGTGDEIVLTSFRSICPDGSGNYSDPNKDKKEDNFWLEQYKLKHGLSVPMSGGYSANNCQEFYLQNHMCKDYYYWTGSRGFDKIGTFCDLSDPQIDERPLDVTLMIGERQYQENGWLWSTPIKPNLSPGDAELCKYGYEVDKIHCKPE